MSLEYDDCVYLNFKYLCNFAFMRKLKLKIRSVLLQLCLVAPAIRLQVVEKFQGNNEKAQAGRDMIEVV